MRRPLLALLAVLTPTASMAQSARPCLTVEEAGGLVTFALPSALSGLSRQCAKSLPATAELIQGVPVLAARYQPEADRAWPMARQAFDKLAGSSLSQTVGDEAARNLITGLLDAAVGQQVKAEDCGAIDRLVGALSPLPARNMANLVVVLMEVGGRGKAADRPFSLCAAKQG